MSKLPKNISESSSGKFYVRKYFNGKHYSFGSYSTLDEAIKYRNYFESKGWPLEERFLNSTPKFIVEYKGKFKVEKSFGNRQKGDRKRYSYGTFENLEDAIEHRDECIRNNWDARLRAPKVIYRYIQRKKGRYLIIKDNVSYGFFQNLDEAIRERDLLVKCNWDYDALCESIDETDKGKISWLDNKVMMR